MKKKIITSLLAMTALIAIIAPTAPADAQTVVYTRKCCDADYNVRCVLVNWTPVGNDCFCYGQGWGFAC